MVIVKGRFFHKEWAHMCLVSEPERPTLAVR